MTTFKQMAQQLNDDCGVPEELRNQFDDLIAKAIQIGYTEGLKPFAWMKDGTYYVGTCGTTLKSAIQKVVDTSAPLM